MAPSNSLLPRIKTGSGISKPQPNQNKRSKHDTVHTSTPSRLIESVTDVHQDADATANPPVPLSASASESLPASYDDQAALIRLENFMNMPATAPANFLCHEPEPEFAADWFHRADVAHNLLFFREYFDISRRVVGLAIAILDRFLSTFADGPIHKDNISLVLSGCLLIATKQDSQIAAASISEQIYWFCNYEIDPSMLITMESTILNTLNWTVNLQTPYHYIEQVVLIFTPGDRASLAYARHARNLIDIAIFALDVALVNPRCSSETPANLTFAAANLAFAIDGTEPRSDSPLEPVLYSHTVHTVTGTIAQAWLHLVNMHNSGHNSRLVISAPSHLTQLILDPTTLAQIIDESGVDYPPTAENYDSQS